MLRSLGGGLLAAGLGAGAASAQQRFPPSKRTRWGRPQQLGEGTMATFFTESRSGTPRYLGVWFTADALDGLPDGGHSPAHVTTLPLPAAAQNGSPVRWVTADWNPEGHVPADVYDVPHFDFHFYLQPQAVVEREVRPGLCDVDGDGTPDAGVPCDVLERGTEPVPPSQRPPGYEPTDEIVPRMGNHWVNVDAPEFRGEPFTHTWIYGSFDGELTFLEPMVAVDYLRNLRGREITSVATPDAFPRSGFYPTEYVVRRFRDQDAFAVYLRRFQLFDAT
ncbi:hypothetical protein [Halorussus sp. AFM4]|uniref:hypothetical protein n=1 Tax=Halorussus sp. AFM4 TaxID=3421651 RepID=UPI003EC077B6